MDASDLKKEIVRISHIFYQRGWSLATSGNYSARVDNKTILITASGKDKGVLQEDDILSIAIDGPIQSEGVLKPSAEAYLHCELYRADPNIGAILHTHSVYSTVVSSLPHFKAPVSIGGYEMLKALSGVHSHVHTENIPVFPNDQDMKALAQTALEYLKKDRSVHGFLIVAHGLYCWGTTLAETLRHAEALEFLLECEYRKRVESR